MATSTFDRVFVVTKKADRARLKKILASKKPIPEYELPVYSPDDWLKNEATVLECFSCSET